MPAARLGALPLIAVLYALGLVAGAQPPAAIDASAIGPKIGEPAPSFAGVDQFGHNQTLASSRGPKGAMLVFFRSADW